MMTSGGILLLVGALAADAWEYGPWVYYTFKPHLQMKMEGQNTRVWAFFPKPHETSAQKVLGIYQNTEAFSLYEKVDKLKLNTVVGAEVELQADKSKEFTWTACIGRRRIRLNTPALTQVRDLRPRERTRLREFLELTPGTGADDPVLAQVATSMTGENPLHLARSIYDRVLERMQYEKKLSFKGATRAWQEQVGECGDYASLFVSLCRLAGIPARSVAGFTFTDEEWQHHVWAEFYIAGLGWVPCDPSFGDAGPNAADAYFGQLDDRRVAVSRDIDLDFSPPDFLKVSLLQEYLYTYDGGQKPTLQWHVQGESLGETVPRDVRQTFGVPAVLKPLRSR